MTEYTGHEDQLGWVSAEAEARRLEMLELLERAFGDHVEYEELPVVAFRAIDEEELARIIMSFPMTLKPLLALCNVAARAIKRDLGWSVNTYRPRLNEEQAVALSAYLLRHLPSSQSIDGLATLDHVMFRDKEMRRMKGGWEDLTIQALNDLSSLTFAKRRFRVGDDTFEIDAASPITGDIDFAVDVKRVESPRDKHKRGDEVLNKAVKFKQVRPEGRFGSVVYYPFPEDQEAFRRRLSSDSLDSLVFAGATQESVEIAVAELIAEMEIPTDA